MLPDIRDIKKARKRIGITQKELAAMSGVSQSLIAKIESGTVRPAYENIKSILEAMESLGKGEKMVAKDIMSVKLVSVKRTDKVENAISMMRKFGYSQLPVFERGYPVGDISERTIVDIVSNGKDISEILSKDIDSVMDESLPTVKENESVEAVSILLKTNPAVLVAKEGKALGIITKADLFKTAKTK
jgi:predicted transcriptional regulator